MIMTEAKHVPYLRIEAPLFFDENNYSIPTSAKELTIAICTAQQACELNGLWHSRFPKIDWSNVVRNKRYVCFTAAFDGIYYAVGIWSSPIAANRMKDGDACLELRRLAIAPDAPKFTATFMLKKMRKWVKSNFPEIKKLVSYQDTEAHKGIIYKADNWTVVDTGYKETDWSHTGRVRSAAQSDAKKLRWEYYL